MSRTYELDALFTMKICRNVDVYGYFLSYSYLKTRAYQIQIVNNVDKRTVFGIVAKLLCRTGRNVNDTEFVKIGNGNLLLERITLLLGPPTNNILPTVNHLKKKRTVMASSDY